MDLRELPVFQTALITRVTASPKLKNRLMALSVAAGERITVLKVVQSRVYVVKTATLAALGEEVARCVHVTM